MTESERASVQLIKLALELKELRLAMERGK
jgi:hypothetical protein